MKSCNEDPTSTRTTAKPVDDVKGDEETISNESPTNQGEIINKSEPLHSRNALEIVTFFFLAARNSLGC